MKILKNYSFSLSVIFTFFVPNLSMAADHLADKSGKSFLERRQEIKSYQQALKQVWKAMPDDEIDNYSYFCIYNFLFKLGSEESDRVMSYFTDSSDSQTPLIATLLETLIELDLDMTKYYEYMTSHQDLIDELKNLSMFFYDREGRHIHENLKKMVTDEEEGLHVNQEIFLDVDEKHLTNQYFFGVLNVFKLLMIHFEEENDDYPTMIHMNKNFYPDFDKAEHYITAEVLSSFHRYMVILSLSNFDRNTEINYCYKNINELNNLIDYFDLRDRTEEINGFEIRDFLKVNN